MQVGVRKASTGLVRKNEWLEGMEEDQVSDAFGIRPSTASLARNEREEEKKVEIVR